MSQAVISKVGKKKNNKTKSKETRGKERKVSTKSNKVLNNNTK